MTSPKTSYDTLGWLPTAPLVLAALLVYPHVAAVYLVPHTAVLAQHQPRQQQQQHPVLLRGIKYQKYQYVVRTAINVNNCTH